MFQADKTATIEFNICRYGENLMNLSTIIVIAFALAMDAFAVAICSGAAIKNMRLHHAFRIAAFFGFFQALMPLFGWALGQTTAHLVRDFDHWIAFTILLIIGGKMLYEAFYPDRQRIERRDPLNIYVLIMLSIATSIDAAAVGISMACLDIDILEPILIIGVITFIVSLLGTYIGKKGNEYLEGKVEIIGGLALIGIGIKILIEHLSA